MLTSEQTKTRGTERSVALCEPRYNQTDHTAARVNEI